VETVDGSIAAHWEHTIAVTEDGPRILTVNAGSPAEERSVDAVGVA
jgi:methionyl aminopeptidase